MRDSTSAASDHFVVLKVGIPLRVLVLAFCFFIAGCADVPSGKYPGLGSDTTTRSLTLWLLSDIQPRANADRADFELAIDDINEHSSHVDLAVVAGDLLKSRSREPAFEWFQSQRDRSKVRYWFEIAGNHDARSGDIFYQYFPRPPFYGVEIGNITLLLLSDQSVASQTEISDEAFSWWRKQVETNQDRILITVTHAHLRKSGLLGAAVASRRIKDSARFEQVLRDQRVAVWASGHSHLPHGLAGTMSVREDMGEICFVNVSSIDRNFFMDSQSRILIFSEESDIAWIRSRNHSKKRFEPSLDFPIRLKKKFTWDGSPPRVFLPERL